MIFDALLLIPALILGMINFILGLFTLAVGFIMPSAITEVWTTLFSYAHKADGIFPMTDALLAMTFVLTVLILKYCINFVFMIMQLIPWVGTASQAKTPSHN